jgi:hypothetical protein
MIIFYSELYLALARLHGVLAGEAAIPIPLDLPHL